MIIDSQLINQCNNVIRVVACPTYEYPSRREIIKALTSVKDLLGSEVRAPNGMHTNARSNPFNEVRGVNRLGGKCNNVVHTGVTTMGVLRLHAV